MSNETICPNCAAARAFETVTRPETYKVRGEQFSFSVRVKICLTCQEALFEEKRDQALLEQAYAEYRKRKNLLSPHEIVQARRRFGLSQRGYALLLGMAQPTIARYEKGAIQDDAHDRLIRAYSTPENMRALLVDRGHLLAPEQRQLALEKASSGSGAAGDFDVR